MSMEPSTLEMLCLDPIAEIPKRAHATDAGLDLSALESVDLLPGKPTLLSTGLAVAIPEGHVGLICDRSSLGKKGIKTLGGVIDSGYRGEVKVILCNLTPNEIEIKKSDRIAQLLVLPIATPSVLSVRAFSETTTSRGQGGFGSTGR